MNKRVSLFTPAFISFFYLIYILDPECILFDGNSRKILHFLGGGLCIDIWGRARKLWSVEGIWYFFQLLKCMYVPLLPHAMNFYRCCCLCNKIQRASNTFKNHTKLRRVGNDVNKNKQSMFRVFFFILIIKILLH